jgi:S-adenosylmethionine hydrolase
MAIITLTTDWGTRDYYIAIVKGIIYSNLPDAKIVDISHDISSFDYLEAQHVIKNAYPYFPSKTVHLIGLETNSGKGNSNPIAINYKDQFFLGNDNGIFSLLFGELTEGIIEIETSHIENKMFLVRDALLKAAIHLAKGGSIEDLGHKKDSIMQRMLPSPTFENNSIRGSVVYVDRFENIVTNISKELFDKVRNGRKFTILLNHKYYIHRLSTSYNDVGEAELLAYFNSEGFLEISMNLGKTASMFNLDVHKPIRIEFDDNTNS